MRRLDPLEVPPALTTLFGADDPVFVLPSAASDAEQNAWRDLAAAWAKPGEPRLVLDGEIETLPEGSVWILGWGNVFANALSDQVTEQGAAVNEGSVIFPTDEMPRADHSLVLVARAESDPAAALGWVAAEPVEAIPGLARKLPHYTRYSYLGFKGSEPENVAKGMWQPLSSPLVRNLSDGEMAELSAPRAAAPRRAAGGLRRRSAAATPSTIWRSPASRAAVLARPGLDAATAWVEAHAHRSGVSPADADGLPAELDLDGRRTRAVHGTDQPGRGRPGFRSRSSHRCWSWPTLTTSARVGRMFGPATKATSIPAPMTTHQASRSCSNSRGPWRPNRRGRGPCSSPLSPVKRPAVSDPNTCSVRCPEDERPYACINLDTVGRLADGELFILNADSAREWRFIFMGVGYTTGAPIKVVTGASGQLGSDELHRARGSRRSSSLPDRHRTTTAHPIPPTPSTLTVWPWSPKPPTRRWSISPNGWNR